MSLTRPTPPSPFSAGWKLPEGVEHVSSPIARVMQALTVRHGAWTIHYDPPPIPARNCDYGFWHDDYDGAEDANDHRCGFGATVEDCLAQIAAIEAELQGRAA